MLAASREMKIEPVGPERAPAPRPDEPGQDQHELREGSAEHHLLRRGARAYIAHERDLAGEDKTREGEQENTAGMPGGGEGREQSHRSGTCMARLRRSMGRSAHRPLAPRMGERRR